MRLRHYLDLDGEPITLDGCGCDMDSPCNDARCQMERDLDMRAAFASFNRQRQVRPELFGMTYAEQMLDAGRGHLLTPDELCAHLMSTR